MQRLGLTISQKKLVSPPTKGVCSAFLINTKEGSISIPDEKLPQVTETVAPWLDKSTCTKCQLQSILGLLLYVHKCVKPARVFLNNMLDLLSASHAFKKITSIIMLTYIRHWSLTPV